MKPRRIFLVRHAESELNEAGARIVLKPDHQYRLTSRGQGQAAAVGRALATLLGSHPYGIYVSPYRRAMQTMQIASEQFSRPPAFVYQDPRLREQDYGPVKSREDSLKQREQRAIYGTFFYRFPGGESCADVFDRMSAFQETLHRSFSGNDYPRNVLVFTHGTAMRCFLMRWYHWTVEDFERMKQTPPNCHIVLMEKATAQEMYLLSEPFGTFFCCENKRRS